MKANPTTSSCPSQRLVLGLIAASFGCLLLAPAARAQEWPSFRRGVWHFERTLAMTNRAGNPEQDRVLLKEDIKRCVDPSEYMKETFRPLNVGNCHSARPQRTANTFVFPLRCDYMGPVRTTIDVESDTAYTEVNEVQVGQFPRTDTVIARRISACD